MSKSKIWMESGNSKLQVLNLLPYTMENYKKIVKLVQFFSTLQILLFRFLYKSKQYNNLFHFCNENKMIIVEHQLGFKQENFLVLNDLLSLLHFWFFEIFFCLL